MHNFLHLESKPVLAIVLLAYLLLDTRIKADHTKIIKFIDVSSIQYVNNTQSNLTITIFQLHNKIFMQ